MAYISKYSGEELDNTIIINADQNNRLNSLETNLSNLNNTITTILNTELEPIKNNMNNLGNNMNNLDDRITAIGLSLNNLKFQMLTYNEYLNLATKDNYTLYIILD